MASIKTIENQALALAGVFQAVYVCKLLATTGRCDDNDLAPLLRSVLSLDANNVLEAYGGSAAGLRLGLRVIKNQFGGLEEARDLDIARYALALVQLGTNVMTEDSVINQLRNGINHAQTLDFEITDPVMVNKLADLYRQCISGLSPRIMVSGDQTYLEDERIAASIRAALLAGVRSVVLWRQCGGSRPKPPCTR